MFIGCVVCMHTFPFFESHIKKVVINDHIPHIILETPARTICSCQKRNTHVSNDIAKIKIFLVDIVRQTHNELEQQLMKKIGDSIIFLH